MCRKAKPVVGQEAGASNIRKLPARAVPSAVQAPSAVCAAPNLELVDPPKPRVEPVQEDRFSLNIRFDEAFKAKLAKAREALSHSVPTGDLLSVIERGLDLILEAAAKKQGAAPVRARAAAEVNEPVATMGRNHVPADLTRKVWQRDERCCTWVLASGERCDSTWQLELDHIVAVARGGTTELGNVRLLCRAHNQLHARQTFGAEQMERAMRRAPP